MIILLHLRRKKMSRKREPFSINFCFFVHKKYISNYFLSNYCTDYRVLVTKDFYGYWLPWLEIVDSHDWFWSKLCIPSTLNTRPFNVHLDFWKSRSWEIKIWFKPKKNFRSSTPGFFLGVWYKSSFFSRWRPRKKCRFAGPEIFLRFEADLNFSRPWFSEIKVQIKRPNL